MDLATEEPGDLAALPRTWTPGLHAVYLQRYPAGRRVVLRLEVTGPPGKGGTPLLALTREGERDLEMLWLVDTTAEPPRVHMQRMNPTRGPKPQDGDDVALQHATLVENLVRDALSGGKRAADLPRAVCGANRFGVVDAVALEKLLPAGRLRYLLSPRCALLGVLETQARLDAEGVVAGLQLVSQGGTSPVLSLDDLRRVDLGGVSVEAPRAWLPRLRGLGVPGQFEPLLSPAWFLSEGGPGRTLEGVLGIYKGSPADVEARRAHLAKQDAEHERARDPRGLTRRDLTGPHRGSIARYSAKGKGGTDDAHVSGQLVRADGRALLDLKLSLSLDPRAPGAPDDARAFAKLTGRLIDTIRFDPPG